MSTQDQQGDPNAWRAPAAMLAQQAQMAAATGDLEEASACADEAFALLPTEPPVDIVSAVVLLTCADTALATGKVGSAAPLYQSALAQATALDGGEASHATHLRLRALLGLARCHGALGQAVRAAECYQSALTLLAKLPADEAPEELREMIEEELRDLPA